MRPWCSLRVLCYRTRTWADSGSRRSTRYSFWITNQERNVLGHAGTKSSAVARSVGVGIALVTLTLAGCAAAGFPTGSGTATITWHSVDAPNGGSVAHPQPFSGSIAGVPLTGKSVMPVPHVIRTPEGSVSLPSTLVLAHLTGSFQGQPFVLTLSAKTSELRNLFHSSSLLVDVVGTYGSQVVKGTATVPASHPNTLRIMGTVGHHHVTCTVRPTQHGAANTATATFTVTG